MKNIIKKIVVGLLLGWMGWIGTASAAITLTVNTDTNGVLTGSSTNFFVKNKSSFTNQLDGYVSTNNNYATTNQLGGYVSTNNNYATTNQLDGYVSTNNNYATTNQLDGYATTNNPVISTLTVRGQDSDLRYLPRFTCYMTSSGNLVTNAYNSAVGTLPCSFTSTNIVYGKMRVNLQAAEDVNKLTNIWVYLQANSAIGIRVADLAIMHMTTNYPQSEGSGSFNTYEETTLLTNVFNAFTTNDVTNYGGKMPLIIVRVFNASTTQILTNFTTQVSIIMQ